MKLDHRGVLVLCPSCGTTNRLQYRSLERTTRCGKCRTTLPVPSAPIEVSDQTAFDALVSGSSVPVIVDFWDRGLSVPADACVKGSVSTLSVG